MASAKAQPRGGFAWSHFIDAGKADLLTPQRQLSVEGHDAAALQPSPKPFGLRSRNASYSDMGSALPASISSVTSTESGLSLSSGNSWSYKIVTDKSLPAVWCQ